MGKGRTHEEFIEDFYNSNMSVKEIDIIGKYINVKTKILCKCKKCYNEWKIRPDALLSGQGCPKCANIKKSIDYKGRRVNQNPAILKQKFMNKYTKSNTNIELLGEYINSETKIKVKCRIHKTVWDGNPRSILKGIGCKECRNEKFSKTMIKSQRQFEDEIKSVNPKIKIIGKYTGCENKIPCRCLDCGFEWEAHIQPLLNGLGCRKCSSKIRGEKQRLTEDEFLSKLNNINKDIIPLEPYVTSHKKISFMCKNDGYIWKEQPTNILQSKGCPVCSNRAVLNGVNDIATTHPHILKYLKYREDGYKHVYGSNKKIIVKCPDCGNEKEMVIHSLTTNGFFCNVCSDKISYPNKFIRGFIQQLDVKNIIYEYSPKWANLYRYDLYFELNNKKYIIEMDGGFHFLVTTLTNKKELKIQQKRDKEKDCLAKENNIILIRIDYLQSEKNYIKNNIINSELSSVFDLSYVDWDLCDNHGKMNLIKEVCDFYNENQNISIISISKYFKLDRHSITKYLKVGAKYKFCDYSVEKSKLQRLKSSSNPICVFDDNDNIIHNFSSLNEASRKMKEIYGDGFSVTSIRNHCNDGKVYKGFIFKYAS